MSEEVEECCEEKNECCKTKERSSDEKNLRCKRHQKRQNGDCRRTFGYFAAHYEMKKVPKQS